MSDKPTPIFEPPREQDRKPIDRYLEMTMRYNYLRDLREARKPNLYGIGIDFYDEERSRAEQGRGW
ncbi:MAG TPA: hypothetical protein VF131_22970 [Blastocatellia bacterium]|nr:hypothetical protein [Blastocatellia bacterium]